MVALRSATLRAGLNHLSDEAWMYGVRACIEVAGGQVQVRVCNDGPDIAPEDQLRLFDRFYRADAARRHAPAEGTGLGLAISRDIVREFHGDLEADNRPGGGACFTVRLPAAPDPEEEPTTT